MIHWLRRKLGVEALAARLTEVESRLPPREGGGSHADDPDVKRREVTRALNPADSKGPPPPPPCRVDGQYL